MQLRTTTMDNQTSYWHGHKFIAVSGPSASLPSLRMVTISPDGNTVTVYVKQEEEMKFIELIASMEMRPL